MKISRDKRNSCAIYIGCVAFCLEIAGIIEKGCDLFQTSSPITYISGSFVMATLILMGLETKDRQTDAILKAWIETKDKNPSYLGKTDIMSLERFVSRTTTFLGFLLDVFLIVGNVLLSAFIASKIYLLSGDIALLIVNFTIIYLLLRNLHLLLDYCLLRKKMAKITDKK